MLWILEHVEQLNPADVLACIPQLSEPRRARVLAMGNAAAQVRSILAELLLRYALRQEYGLSELPRIEFGEKGKPFFPDRPELHFNLSHCKTAVACALDAALVGVDVQEVRSLRRPSETGRGDRPGPSGQSAERAGTFPAVYRVLSGSELAWVEAGETPFERDRRFTAVWTCKEAWGKATGEGFLYDMKATDFRPESRSWQQYGCVFQHHSMDGTLLTLCAQTPLPTRTILFSDLYNNLKSGLEV